MNRADATTGMSVATHTLPIKKEQGAVYMNTVCYECKINETRPYSERGTHSREVRERMLSGLGTLCSECRSIISTKSANPFTAPQGTTKISPDGYVSVKKGKKWVFQHRLVMEEVIGRQMAKHETVHHINGIRDDNRPENLELWVGGIRYGQRAADIRCPHCTMTYN